MPLRAGLGFTRRGRHHHLDPPILCASRRIVGAACILVRRDRGALALARHAEFALADADLPAEPVGDRPCPRFGQRPVITVVALAVGMADDLDCAGRARADQFGRLAQFDFGGGGQRRLVIFEQRIGRQVDDRAHVSDAGIEAADLARQRADLRAQPRRRRRRFCFADGGRRCRLFFAFAGRIRRHIARAASKQRRRAQRDYRPPHRWTAMPSKGAILGKLIETVLLVAGGAANLAHITPGLDVQSTPIVS